MSSEEQPQPPLSVGPLSVGIVGATGMVGELMRAILAERNFPVGSLRLFASARSAGKRRAWQDQEIVVEDAETADYSGLDVVFFSAGGETSRKLAPVVAAAGAIVIDNSSAWRSDPKVPLVVAEVNPHALKNIPKGIVANPNCTTMAAMPVLKPLNKARACAGWWPAPTRPCRRGPGRRRRARGPDASAGVGATALVHDGSAVEFAPAAKWAVAIAYNVVPLNYRIVENGYSEDEIKLRDESRKILEIPDLAVSATCVRVPVWTAIRCRERRVRPAAAGRQGVEILRAAPGVELSDVPNPLQATGRDAVFVGRVRPDPRQARARVFVSGDNCARGRRSMRCRSPSCCRPAPGAQKRLLETA